MPNDLYRGARVRWCHPHFPAAVPKLGRVVDFVVGQWLVVLWDGRDIETAHPWHMVGGWIRLTPEQLSFDEVRHAS